MPPKIATAAQFAELRNRINGGAPNDAKPSRKSKYGNVRTMTATGKMADSKREASEVNRLFQRQMDGQIANLRQQVTHSLCVNNVLVCSYKSDAEFLVLKPFTIETKQGPLLLVEGQGVVLDAKGAVTKEYAIKRRLMLACKGLEILEV